MPCSDGRCVLCCFGEQISSSDRVLIMAFREIGQMADRLNLPAIIAVVIIEHILLVYIDEFNKLKTTY